MTPLRRKRLLLLAWFGGDCKSWYSSYCEMMYNEDPSPIYWMVGHAWLTDSGRDELEQILGHPLPTKRSRV